jgi:hypothetical protein
MLRRFVYFNLLKQLKDKIKEDKVIPISSDIIYEKSMYTFLYQAW